MKITKYIPDWNQEDYKIIEKYEKDKREGKIKDIVIIPKEK